MKMISFIKSFCKYRRFVSDPSKCQEFEEYLHLEVQKNKESKSLFYLLSFLLIFQTQRLAQIRSCRAVALGHACVSLAKTSKNSSPSSGLLREDVSPVASAHRASKDGK